MHHVVVIAGDEGTQLRQCAQLGVAPHAQIAHARAGGPDLLRHRAGVVERHHIAVVPGVLQDHGQLDLGAADIQTGDHVQDLHGRFPFMARYPR